MIITLKNTTKRMLVYQLEQRYAAGSYKSRSENVVRLRSRPDGGADIRQQRLRHGPVLRLLAGETKEVPAALLHDPQLRRDTKGRRAPLKILKRESDEEHHARVHGAAKPKAALEPAVFEPEPEPALEPEVHTDADVPADAIADDAQPSKPTRRGKTS